jgi:hypothetical protein
MYKFKIGKFLFSSPTLISSEFNEKIFCLLHAAGKKCKFEHKYICGIQDCNCRYVSENGESVSSLYKRFLAMFTDSNDGSAQVCDKCDVFCSKYVWSYFVNIFLNFEVNIILINYPKFSYL